MRTLISPPRLRIYEFMLKYVAEAGTDPGKIVLGEQPALSKSGPDA